jgi:prepilin-type N-terminal cleavage/methylation domain-containing protein
MKNKKGFTLIEMLVATVIGFIIIILVYQTMQITIRVSKDVREKLARMQTTNFFLTSFSGRLLCMVPDSSENSFSSDQISIEVVEYKKRKIITYIVEPNEYGKYNLSVKEKDIFYDTEYEYPAIKDLDSFEFQFFDGDSWITTWEKETIPTGISVNFEKDNTKTFFPVAVDIQSQEVQQ